MALADIEARIIREAEAEAAKIISAANAESLARLKKTQTQMAAERKQSQEKAEKNVFLALEQKKQLLTLESSQKVLSRKREYLLKLVQEVQQEILQDEKKLTGFYKKILMEVKAQLGSAKLIETAETGSRSLKQVLQELGLKLEVKSHKEWSAGSLELSFERSRMNCSLDIIWRKDQKYWSRK